MLFTNLGIEHNPHLVQVCQLGDALAIENISRYITPSIYILDVAVNGFQTYHRRERILQKQSPRVQMDDTHVSVHIIFEILRVRQTT